MNTYSHFFSTIYDEAGPVGQLGRGTHYSILRSLVWRDVPQPQFHDVAVIWDEDHDLRIIWVLEQLCVRGLLLPILAIGERKGSVTVLTKNRHSAAYANAVEGVTTNVPSDSFSSEVELLTAPTAMIIHDSEERVRNYLAGIDALWLLGAKPCEFTVGPFYRV